MIGRAVLLAAGRGTRLGELTAETPKPLLQVGRRPIIVRIMDGLVRARIEEFAIVTGYLAAKVEYELGNGAQAGVSVRYFRQERQEGTARALALAREFVGEEKCFFGWGDIVVRPENYRAVIKAGTLADAAIAVNEVDDPYAGAAVYFGEDRVVTRMVEKPARGSSSTRWNNAGFGVLGPGIWPEIERLAPSEGGEYDLPRAIAALAVGGARVVAVPVEGPWFDIGTVESLAAARREFGDG